MSSSQGPRDYMGSSADAGPLANAREGMTVYDATGEEIGSVGEVRMADQEAADLQPAQVDTDSGGSVVESATDAIAGTDDDVSTRMLQSGYFKLDSKGLFASDKYVLPTTIESVDADGVRLNVDKDNIPDPA